MTDQVRYTRSDAVSILNYWYNTRYSILQIQKEVGCSRRFIKRVIKGDNFGDIKRPDILPNWRY